MRLGVIQAAGRVVAPARRPASVTPPTPGVRAGTPGQPAHRVAGAGAVRAVLTATARPARRVLARRSPPNQAVGAAALTGAPRARERRAVPVRRAVVRVARAARPRVPRARQAARARPLRRPGAVAAAPEAAAGGGGEAFPSPAGNGGAGGGWGGGGGGAGNSAGAVGTSGAGAVGAIVITYTPSGSTTPSTLFWPAIAADIYYPPLPHDSAVAYPVQIVAAPPAQPSGGWFLPGGEIISRGLSRESVIARAPGAIAVPISWGLPVSDAATLKVVQRESSVQSNPQFIQTPLPAWRSAALFEPMLRALPRDPFTPLLPPQVPLTQYPAWRSLVTGDPTSLRPLPKESVVNWDPEIVAAVIIPAQFGWFVAPLGTFYKWAAKESAVWVNPQFIQTPLPAWRGAAIGDPITLRLLPKESGTVFPIVPPTQFFRFGFAVTGDPASLRALPRDSFTLSDTPQFIQIPLPAWRSATLFEPMLRALPREPFSLFNPPQTIVAPVFWHSNLAVDGLALLESVLNDSEVLQEFVVQSKLSSGWPLVIDSPSGRISFRESVTAGVHIIEVILHTRGTGKLDFSRSNGVSRVLRTYSAGLGKLDFSKISNSGLGSG